MSGQPTESGLVCSTSLTKNQLTGPTKRQKTNANKQTNKHTNRKTYRQTNTQTDKQTNKQAVNKTKQKTSNQQQKQQQQSVSFCLFDQILFKKSYTPLFGNQIQSSKEGKLVNFDIGESEREDERKNESQSKRLRSMSVSEEQQQ